MTAPPSKIKEQNARKEGYKNVKMQKWWLKCWPWDTLAGLNCFFVSLCDCWLTHTHTHTHTRLNINSYYLYHHLACHTAFTEGKNHKHIYTLINIVKNMAAMSVLLFPPETRVPNTFKRRLRNLRVERRRDRPPPNRRTCPRLIEKAWEK